MLREKIMKMTGNKAVLAACAAGLICFFIYLPAIRCKFVNWEDQDYVLNNESIRNLDMNLLVWAFTTMPLGFWFPLTWLSFALDYHFWAFNPAGYHLTNIVLHAVNTGLVVLIADELLKKKYRTTEASPRQGVWYWGILILAGLIFGIHPARVESVAWVTERKDVLNGIFTFSSIFCYLRYVREKESTGNSNVISRWYLVSLMLFFLSLAAKPSSVVVPVMLLIMDWYPLGRLRQGSLTVVLTEKIPYLALAASLTVLTIVAGAQEGMFNTVSGFPLSERMIASGNALFEYIKLMIYPVGILPYYDLPWPLPHIYLAKAAALVCFVIGCIWWGRRRPWIAATTIFFVMAIIPTLHLFASGWQLIIASRYTYLPSLAPSIAAAGIIASMYRGGEARRRPWFNIMLAGLVITGLVFYAAMTQRLIGAWTDSGTMWSRVIAGKPFDRAYFYRGLYYEDSKDYSAAIQDFTSCLDIVTQTHDSAAIYNLHAFRGEALMKSGRYEDAVRDFDLAISMFPHRLYYYHRGQALNELGRIKEAETDMQRAGKARGGMFWFPAGSPLF